MLLMHNLSVHRKAGIDRRKISSFLTQLLENEMLYSSDSECEYRFTTTVCRIAKIKSEIVHPSNSCSDDDSKSRKRITRSGGKVKQEALDVGTELLLHNHDESKTTSVNQMEMHSTIEIGEGEGEDDVENGIAGDASDDNYDSDDSDGVNAKAKSTSGFPCNMCGKIYEDKDSILKHFKASHCDDEDALAFVLDVIDKHNGGAGLPCTKCSTVFSNRDSLHRHMRKVHQIPNKDTETDKTSTHLTCDVCGKVFYRPKCFETHLKKHEAPKSEKRKIKYATKTHLCSFCGKSYPGSNHLKIHLRIHTGMVRGHEMRTSDF